MELNLDREKMLATIALAGELDANGVDALIRKLALLRADMQPVVPLQFDQASDLGAVLDMQLSELVMATLSSGDFRLSLRHAGLGWISFVYTRQQAKGMANYLGAAFGNDAHADHILKGLTH